MDELKLKITLDNGEVVDGFLNIEKQAKNTSKKTEESLSTGLAGVSEDIVGLAKSFAPVALAAGAAAKVISETFGKTLSLIREGESLLKIEKTFNSLASQAGISADVLRTSFIGSLDGLIDDSDAVESLNKSLITLGERAAASPQLLELARKATNAFGGDVIQNFEAINQAVASGATRQLKAIGLQFDATAALEKYAKSLGVSKDQLSEAGKQQAILNGVLEIGGNRFKNISSEIGGLTSAQQRLSVTLKNIGDELAIFTQRNYGQFFTDIAVGLNRLIKEANGTTTAKDNIQKLSEQLEKAQNSLNSLSFAKFEREGKNAFTKLFDGFGADSVLNQRIVATNKQIEDLTSQIQKLNAEVPSPVSGLNANATTPKESVVTDTVNQARKQQEAELTTFLANEELKRQNITIANGEMDNQSQINKNLAEFNEQTLLNQRIEAADLQHKINLEALEKQFADKAMITQSEKTIAVESAEATHQAILAQIKKKADDDKQKRQKAIDAAGLAATGTALGQIATLSDSSNKELAAIGKAAAITKATIDGYTAVQNALAMVPFPFNFPAAALVGVAAAANIAKIVSSGGGGGSSAFSAATGGGGIASSPSPITEITPPQELQRQEATTTVSVVIQGDVLDSDESGSRIVSLINQAFDKKGVVINQGAIA